MQVICRYSYNHHFLKNIIYIYKNAVYRHFPFDKIFPVFWLPGFAYYTLLSNKLWLMHNGMLTLLEPQFELPVSLILLLHGRWGYRPSKV